MRTSAFTQGTICNKDGVVKASASGIFKLPKDLDSAQNFSKPEGF